MSVIKVNNITSRDGTTGPVIAGIATVSTTSHLVVPTGNTGTRYADDGENIVKNGLVVYLDSKYSYLSKTGIGTTASGATATPGSSLDGEPYTWYDMSGYGNNGELVGGVGFGTTTGGFLIFDGNDDYISLGRNNVTSPSQITVSVWFNSSSIPPTEVKKLARNRTYGYEIGVSTTGILNGSIWVNDSINTGITATGISTIVTNTWYNGTITFGSSSNNTSDGELKIYLNGSNSGITTSSVTTVDNTLFYNNTNGFLAIGRDGDSANANFNGRIAQVLIYNRALSAAEVLQNYNALKSRFGL